MRNIEQTFQPNNDWTGGEDRYVPDDLPLLLWSSRPEPQDYVAHLNRDKDENARG